MKLIIYEIISKYKLNNKLANYTHKKFISSCIDFYSKNKFLTPKQIDILITISNEQQMYEDLKNKNKSRRNWMNNPDYWDLGIMFDLDLCGQY